ESIFTEGKQVGEQKTVSRFDFILVVFGLFFIARPNGVTSKWKCHVAPTPIVASPSPFFCASSISLRRLAVIEEKPRIAFERVEIRAVRKNKRRAYEIAGPIIAAFSCPRVQEDQILSSLRIRVIFVGGVKVTKQRWRILQRLAANVPGDVADSVA